MSANNPKKTKKRLLIVSPFLSQSGYGVHSRDIVNAMLDYEEFDVACAALNWGEMSWISPIPETYRGAIEKWTNWQKNSIVPDCVVCNTMPNEYAEYKVPAHVVKHKIPFIGFTAGIECHLVPPKWIPAVNNTCDALVVPSKHSAKGFYNTIALNTITKQDEVIRPSVYIVPESISIPIKQPDVKYREFLWGKLDASLKTEKNLLTISTFAERKNLWQLILLFLKQVPKDIGLIIKTTLSTDSLQGAKKLYDTMYFELENKFGIPIDEIEGRITIIHGSLSEEELYWLYKYPKINGYISSTSGEGYGLPFLEAASVGLPVIATNWSGHLDFLNLKPNNWIPLPYQLQSVAEFSPNSIWKDVIMPGMNWAYVQDEDIMAGIELLYNDLDGWRQKAGELSQVVNETLNKDVVYKKIRETIVKIFVDKT